MDVNYVPGIPFKTDGITVNLSRAEALALRNALHCVVRELMEPDVFEADEESVVRELRDALREGIK